MFSVRPRVLNFRTPGRQPTAHWILKPWMCLWCLALHKSTNKSVSFPCKLRCPLDSRSWPTAPLSTQSPKPETWESSSEPPPPPCVLPSPSLLTLVGLSSDLRPARGFVQSTTFFFTGLLFLPRVPSVLYRTPRVIILQEPPKALTHLDQTWPTRPFLKRPQPPLSTSSLVHCPPPCGPATWNHQLLYRPQPALFGTCTALFSLVPLLRVISVGPLPSTAARPALTCLPGSDLLCFLQESHPLRARYPWHSPASFTHWSQLHLLASLLLRFWRAAQGFFLCLRRQQHA